MKLNDLLKETFNAQPSEVNDASRLMSFADWDSMNHMLFITRLEESYDVNLTGDEIASMETVGDIRKLLQSKGKEI
ncbi:hypothetical protein BH10BAC4_BH10BAC4_10130 [soil metagenome]